ncbi:MAG: RpiB/LacA/LacB family sugar-phosphate isomerase [Minisyncoccia bacterium]
MKIFIGTDHAGFGLKEKLVPFLTSLGYEVVDMGAHEYVEDDDFPDYIIPVAREVSMHPNEVKGIILGGTGQGEAMCANKFKNVRATVYYGNAGSIVEDKESIIKLSKEHNNANILSLGARFITEDQMTNVVKEWLSAPFSGDERHIRRISKMDNIHE